MDRIVSIVGQVARYAENQPMKAAIIDAGQTITYAQLYRSMRQAAAAMQKRGIVKGSRLLLSASNTADFVTCYLATHLLRAVSIVVEPATPALRLGEIVARSQPTLAIGFDKLGSAIPYSTITGSEAESCEPDAHPDAPTFPDASDIADIMFTTGTTGAPKGVVLSHGNIVSSAKAANAFIGNLQGDIEAIALPLCHSFGLGRLRANLINGSTAILLRGFANIKAIFDAFERHSATGFAMVPAAWEYISRLSGDKLGSYASQIRYVELGSSYMPVSQKRRLMQLLPNTRICMHYGLTEASRSVYVRFDPAESASLQSIGTPAQGVGIRILDPQGNPVAQGETGEVHLCGPNVMLGYLDPAETRQALDGPWFRTGDLAFQTPDGAYTLVGRKKDMINVGGKKVSPAQVEQAVLALGYRDCLCYAIPDALLGQVPALSLVLDGTQVPPTLADLNSSLAKCLLPHQLPQQLKIVTMIPRTPSGKPIRPDLAQN